MNLKIIVLLILASGFSQFLGHLDISNDRFIISEIFLLFGTLLSIKYFTQYTFLELFYFFIASFSHPITFLIALICTFPFAIFVETNVHQLNLILFWSVMIMGTYVRFFMLERLMYKFQQPYEKKVLWHEFLSYHKILSPFLLLSIVFTFPLEGNVIGFIYFPIGIFLTTILYPMYFLLTLTLYNPKLKEKFNWFIKVQNILGLVLFTLVLFLILYINIR